MVVTVDIFLKEDLLKLLKNRFIVIIGDSSKLIAALSDLDHIFYYYKISCPFHSRGNMHMMEHSTVALQVWKLFILTSNSQNYDDIILSLKAWVISMQHSFMGVQINCKWLWSCRILNHAFSPCLELHWRIEQCLPSVTSLPSKSVFIDQVMNQLDVFMNCRSVGVRFCMFRWPFRPTSLLLQNGIAKNFEFVIERTEMILFIVIFVDQRAIYKDLVLLLQRNDYISNRQLRTKVHILIEILISETKHEMF